MKKGKLSRRVGLLAGLSLLLSCAMLVGATFAWFTDGVSSGKNQITAGNLDVELEYSRDMKQWGSVQDRSDLVDPEALWEPGHTEVVYLRLSNKGTLALKYQFSMTVVRESGSVNVDGEDFLLSSFLEYGIVEEPAVYADRAAAVAAVEADALPLTDYSKSGKLLPGDPSQVLALVVYMPETVDNKANYRQGEQRPEIELGVNLFATQLENEADSFGTDYDAAAPWTGELDTAWYDPTASEYVLTTAAELAGFSALTNGTADTGVSTFSLRSKPTAVDFAGKTVKLGADIDLKDVPWTPVGYFAGAFDGQGHTVANVKMSGTQKVAFFSELGGSVKNLTLKNVEARGTRYVAPVAGYMCEAGGLENCHVENATVTATPVAVDGIYDGGQHAAGLAGYADSTHVKGCSVKNVSVSAYRDFGGLVGTVTRDEASGKPISQIHGCSGTGIELTYVEASPYVDGIPNGNMAVIVGRGEADVDDQTRENTEAESGEEGSDEGGSSWPVPEYYMDYVGYYYMTGNELFAGGVQFDPNGGELLCILQTHTFLKNAASLNQRPISYGDGTYYHEGAGFDPYYAEQQGNEILVYNSVYEEKSDDITLRIVLGDNGEMVVTESDHKDLPVDTVLKVTSWYISAPQAGADYAGNYRLIGSSLVCSGINIDVGENGEVSCAVVSHDFAENSNGNVVYEGKTYMHYGAGFEGYSATWNDPDVTLLDAEGASVVKLRWDAAADELTVTESALASLPVGTQLTYAPWN